jgi:hypothetical protein
MAGMEVRGNPNENRRGYNAKKYTEVRGYNAIINRGQIRGYNVMLPQNS